MEKNIIEQINAVVQNAPLKQRRLGEYILNNCQLVSLMSVSSLANKSSVGVATVMRFVKSLGYHSFADFKKSITLATYEKFTIQKDKQVFQVGNTSNGDNLAHTFLDSIDAVERTMNNLDRTQFNGICDLLLSGHEINILGFRTSRALADYLFLQFESLLGQIYNLSENESLIYDRVLRYNEGDVILFINNTPTVEKAKDIAEFCHSLGYAIIVVTDSKDNPLLNFADFFLLTEKNISKRYSVLPTLAVLEAIINEIGKRKSPVSIRKINERDRILRDRGVYKDFTR